MRRFAAILAFLLIATCSFAQGKRLVIVSWDGAADWVVDRLLAEGKLPTIKRMSEQGVHADSVIASSPSKTAPGHASIWTGTWPDKHGVTGNDVQLLPRAEHTLLEKRSGFNSSSLLAEPIWMSAALAGKSVAVLSATQSYPPDPWLAKLREAKMDGNFMSFSGFESSLYSARAITESAPHTDVERFGRKGIEYSFKIGSQDFGAFFSKSDDGTYKDCTLYKTAQGRAAFAAYMNRGTTEFSHPIEMTKGDDKGLMTFALLDLAPDLSHFMLYQGECNAIKGAFNSAKGQLYLDAAGGFHDLPIFGFYEKGELGKTYWQGGDGKAEERLLKIVERDYQRLSDGFRWVAREWDSNLITHYSPCLDSLGHLLMGVLDPNSPRYDKAMADKLWPVYAKCYEMADKWLGDIVAAAGANAIVALVSDHGMEGVGRSISPNRILADAGLLAADGNRTDLTKSKAVTVGGYSVCINTTDWKSGIVEPAQRDAVIQQTIAALLAYKDPDTGKSPITKAVLASAIEGASGGDIFLDFAPGYSPNDGLPAKATSVMAGIGSGTHGFDPNRRSMRAVFYASGPGLSPGRNLGDIRQIDIVPSLCILVGIPTPVDATGKNLRLTQKQ